MNLVDKFISRILTPAQVTHKSEIAEKVFRITIQSSTFKTASYTPGNFLRLFCGIGSESSFKDKVRSYSVWNYDRENSSIDIAACAHSNGPGSRWITSCKPGDTIYFNWHTGKFTLDDSFDSYHFIGDTSALGHLYELRRYLPTGKKTRGIIYDKHKTHFFRDIDGSSPFEFFEMDKNPSEQIIEKIAADVVGEKESSIVYIGGDSRVCVALNKHFRNKLGWSSDKLKVKPFWNPEKTGLE